MRNKKGFTLIELLAVIVILAIIALIATPIVLGIIEDSRNSAKVNSAQFMIDGVETAYAVAYTKSYEAVGNITSKVAGAVPTLEHINEEIDFKSAVSDVKLDNEGNKYLETKTNDGGVTCNFTLVEDEENSGKYVLTSDDCGQTETKVPKTEIGEVSTAQADTNTADPNPADPEQGA